MRGNRIPAGPRRPARPAGPAGRRARVERIDTAPPVTPVVGPTDQPIQAADAAEVGAPRLARHLITLSDGHQVGVAICGRGVPLVLVHGFSAEGILYAQTLSRLVSMGFKVVAIDTAGHGGTLGLPTGGATMADYAELLGRVVDELGIRRAVFMGHSMGGRLVTELVAGRARAGDRRDPARRHRRATPGTAWSTCSGSPRRCSPGSAGCSPSTP